MASLSIGPQSPLLGFGIQLAEEEEAMRGRLCESFRGQAWKQQCSTSHSLELIHGGTVGNAGGCSLCLREGMNWIW